MWPPFLHLSKKAFLSPFSLGNNWTINWKKPYWFILKIAKLSLITSSKNRMINTFIIVNVTPSSFQKGLPSPFSLARNKIYLGTHLKEELTNLFWRLTGSSLFPHKQNSQECEHFANMVNIITLCKG